MEGFLKEVSYLSFSSGVGGGAENTASMKTQLGKAIESMKQAGMR